MPDQDAVPDPTDKAYVQAETMLDDEPARAARRARVLAAVAREAQAPPAVSQPSRPRLSWGRGRWLAAASVAGLSTLFAVRLYPPTATQPPSAPALVEQQSPSSMTRRETPPATSSIAPAPPAPTARAPAPNAAKPVIASPDVTLSPRDERLAAAPPPPPPRIQDAPAPAPPTEPTDALEEAVVTASRTPSPPAASEARSAAMKAASPASRAVIAARLRAAASSGRVSELTALLAQGVSVDAPDADGKTALMTAVQANHPEAVGLLRRQGANPDLKNRAGRSARDMAASIDDPELDQALDLAP